MDQVKATLSVQWHITSRCTKRCRHCYMFESSRYKTEIENELSFSEMMQILDDIADFEKKWGFCINDFFITGGDPVLNPDYKKLLIELKKREKRIYIMGNPESLTTEILSFFKEVGIQQMQMSLDGLKETHDYYRGEGNFDITINALEMLDSYGLNGTIMFTLTGENKDDLIPLMNYVSTNTKAKGFAFDLVCGVGNAKDIKLQLTKEDVKKYFELFLDEKKKIRDSGNRIRISEKSKFLQLIHYDNNDFFPYDTEDFSAIGGCYVGFTCYTILADGAVAACRRFPEIIGKMPEEKMEEIFLNSKLLRQFRRANSFEECGKCMFFKSCRGCPAVTYGYTNSPFSDNPLCFKELLNKDVPQKEWKSKPLNITMAEEAEIVRTMLHNQYNAEYDKLIKNDDFLVLVGTLLGDKKERKRFLTDPANYDMFEEGSLTDRELSFVCYYIESVMRNRIPNPMKYALDI